MAKDLYYVVERHLDETFSCNGVRTIDVYEIIDNVPKTFISIEALSYPEGDYFKGDEEEIQDWLDDNGYGDGEYNFHQL